MGRALALLSTLLYAIAGGNATRLTVHYSEVLKIKCDSLPYRTAYHESICYFVIDAYGGSSGSADQCALVLPGAQLTDTAPEAVWTSLFVDKSDFLSETDSTGKKKAMCRFENQLVSSNGLLPLKTPARKEVEKLTAKVVMIAGQYISFTEGIEPGQTIVLKGFLNADVDQVAINFQDPTAANVALHFKIWTAKGVVVMNSAANMKWNPREEIKPNPFRRGDAFDIRFRIHDNHFQIFVNNLEFYKYLFRLPLSSVTTLWVWGSGHLNFLQLGEKYQPIPYSATLPAMVASDNASVSKGELITTSRWAMPHLLPLPPLVSGQTIIVKGGTYADVDQVAINFQDKTGHVIAFHFNIRFNKGIVVMDSAPAYGKWGKPENKPNPLKKGEPFDIRFRINDNNFEVSVNNAAFHSYMYRLLLSSATHLWVWGSGYLDDIQVGEKYKPVPYEIPGFPVCGQPTCMAQGELYANRVQVADCKSLFISGATFIKQGISFYIDLIRKNGDIALRLEARYDKNIVVLNNRKGAQWGKETIMTNPPFKLTVPYRIVITNEARGFQILVNDAHFATFDHRTCAYDISQIETYGIHQLHMQI